MVLDRIPSSSGPSSHRPPSGPTALTALRPDAVDWVVEPDEDGRFAGRREVPRLLDARPLRREERPASPWPPGLRAFAEVLGALLFIAAGIYGPPILECREMKRQGLFWADMTVRVCVRERVAERVRAADDTLTRFVRGL
ncbi:hypothetical protein [Methylobacterium sp. JK268]